jgi:hypothetical protein
VLDNAVRAVVMANSLLDSRSDDLTQKRRPEAITAIAWLFGLSGIYLGVIGFIMLIAPKLLSVEMIVRLGRPWLLGMELAGPYAFLISGWFLLFIALELRDLRNWARVAATFVCALGVFLLIPVVSFAATRFRWSLLWSGLGIIVRVVVVWYLWQEEMRELFRNG